MEGKFSGAWKGQTILRLMFLVKTKKGQVFILTPFSYLPIEEEIESVETVTMGFEDSSEKESSYEEE